MSSPNRSAAEHPGIKLLKDRLHLAVEPGALPNHTRATRDQATQRLCGVIRDPHRRQESAAISRLRDRLRASASRDDHPVALGSRIRAIASALLVASSATWSLRRRLSERTLSCSGAVRTVSADRTRPFSLIAIAQR